MDMEVEPGRCPLCERIHLHEPEGIICWECNHFYVEDIGTTPTTPESTENIFPESDGLDSVFGEGDDIFPYADSNMGDLNQWNSDDENRHGSLVGRARLHRSLATNGRNLPVDWLWEVLSSEGEGETVNRIGALEEQVRWRNGGDDLNRETDRGATPAAASFMKNLECVVVEDEDDEGLVCVICKDSMLVGSVVNRLPCLHVYHSSCIMPWLNAHNTCPLCRYELPTDDQRMRRSISHGGGGGGGWWFVVAPLVIVVGIGLMLWLGGGSQMDNRSRKWLSLL